MTQIPWRSIIVVIIMVHTINTANVCPQGRLLFGQDCIQIDYIEGCLKYEPNNHCQLCEYGYKPNNGKCTYESNTVDSCCQKYAADGTCLLCAPGLFARNNTCYRSLIAGCLVKRNQYCENCDRNYHNVNGECHKNIQNCRLYAKDGVCQDCLQGYELQRGICVQNQPNKLPPNCRVRNQYNCILCNDNYYLTRRGQCLPFEIGCLKYLKQKCVICQNAFQLFNGECRIEGCKRYNNNGCLQCEANYNLIKGQCKIDNCLQSKNGQCRICDGSYRVRNGRCVVPTNDRCNVCASGFSFINGKCQSGIIGCLQYGSQGCQKCKEGFYIKNDGKCGIVGCQLINNDGCEKCLLPFSITQNLRCLIPFCSSFDQNGCVNCLEGYHLVSGGVCEVNDRNCAAYRKQNNIEACIKCQDGYFVNANNVCQLQLIGCIYQNSKIISCYAPFVQDPKQKNRCYIPHCTQYSRKGCLACQAPFLVSNNVCLIQNCKTVGNNDNCLQCDNGFHLTRGYCILNDKGCLNYDSNDNCNQCAQNFVLNQNRVCVQTVANCIEVNAKNLCSRCQQGYQLFENACVLFDPYCTTPLPGKGCRECISGYHLIDFGCFKNDQFCTRYTKPSNTQFCLECISGYTRNEKQQCVRQKPGCIYESGVCVSCKQPFIFDKDTRSCYVIGCERLNDFGCQRCRKPFQVTGQSCAIPFCLNSNANVCTQCRQGYNLVDGGCLRKDPKCVSFDKNGQCTMCINGFILFNGICIKQDKYCIEYSKEGGCNKCQDDYFISIDKVCLPKQPGCIYQRGQCKYCQLPFKMHQVAKTCRIDGCLEINLGGCVNCKYPFNKTTTNQCQIPNCLSQKDGACIRCSIGYHLRQGLYCAKDKPSCLMYNTDGDCQLCADKYMIMSSGQCQLAEDNCIKKSVDGSKCLACKQNYFINCHYQCQRRDDKCVEYNNGVCSQCDLKHFLYQYICFPYSPGCVQYFGKDCTKCKKDYQLVNGECFKVKKLGLHLQGQDQQYDFEINPIDISKSKYYIDNLSPVSALGQLYYSSVSSAEYQDCSLTSDQSTKISKGWKAQNARVNQYIGFSLGTKEALTFYAVQIENIQKNLITQFYLQYSVDGTKFIRVQQSFKCKNTTEIQTFYFTGIYAKSIRIVITGFQGWPALRLDFFYYDVIRFRKISNLKSLKYLRESIQSNFVDRVDNQLYINQRYFFQPDTTCQDKQVCWTGLELCQSKKIDNIRLQSQGNGSVRQFYLMYSIDGRAFNCYQQCRKFSVGDSHSYELRLDNLMAKNIRVYPTDWIGKPQFAIAYNYS